MANLFLHSNTFSFLFIISVSLVLTILRQPSTATTCQAPPVIFNFGDSNSDTGGLVAGLGYNVVLPYGRLFFRRSTGRLSDGRLLIDFLCQSLDTGLLRPYLDSLGEGKGFENGANFAIAGSTTLPKDVPFSLNIQLMQFHHFKSRSLELASSSKLSIGKFINEEGFKNALYMIDIGQNDLARSFEKGNSYSQTVMLIPQFISEIESGIKRLYNEGGRKFWIHNTGPLGCLPQKLATIKSKNLDKHGCLAIYNSAAKMFNYKLNAMCEELRNQLKDATIIYIDIYTIKNSLIANSNQYGFKRPLMACCGFGGTPYNYNPKISCGHRGANVCNKGSRFISWDGVHYTETADAIVAMKVLSMRYSKPPTPFHFFCRR